MFRNPFKKKIVDSDPDWRVVVDGQDLTGTEKTKVLDMTGRFGMRMTETTINGRYFESLEITRRY